MSFAQSLQFIIISQEHLERGRERGREGGKEGGREKGVKKNKLREEVGNSLIKSLSMLAWIHIKLLNNVFYSMIMAKIIYTCVILNQPQTVIQRESSQ